MYRIMYMSSAKFLFTDEDLENLLANSRISNSKLDITGLLIIKGKTFIQCLEGEKENVEKVFNRIKNDSRHENILILVEEYTKHRLFPDWSMGYKNIKYLTNLKSKKLKDFSLHENIEIFLKEDVYKVLKEFISLD